MIHALGYSSNPFSPALPGRLCRGRERWITPWEGAEAPRVHRAILSGATLADDSAHRARRGLTEAGVHIGRLLRAIFPDGRLVAFKEEGQLARVPDYVEDADMFWAPRSAGRRSDPCQRWRAELGDLDEIHRLVSEDLADGFLLRDTGLPLGRDLEEILYFFGGHGDDSHYPVSRFQPLAIPELLQHAEAVICVHQDKHGPALGIYTTEPLDRGQAIARAAEADGAVPVPFAIPPMLARWDRAIFELRMEWIRTRSEPFPIPPAPAGRRWGAWRPAREE